MSDDATLAERISWLRRKLVDMDRALLATTLEACDGNKSAAALMLGMHRKAVERRAKKLGLEGKSR